MIELFVPYNEALELKNLGIGKFITYACGFYYTRNGKEYNFATPSQFDNIDETYDIGNNFYFAAPLYQQAFKFFREKYNLFGETRTSVVVNENRLTFSGWVIHLPKGESIGEYAGKGETYEEAELECLRKLIEICKNKE